MNLPPGTPDSSGRTARLAPRCRIKPVFRTPAGSWPQNQTSRWPDYAALMMTDHSLLSSRWGQRVRSPFCRASRRRIARHPWRSLIAGGALAFLAVLGCGPKPQVLETARVEQSFQSAPADLQATVFEAVTAIKAGDYARAWAALEPVTSGATLTPLQQESLRDLMLQLQKFTTNTPSATPGGTSNTADRVISPRGAGQETRP